MASLQEQGRSLNDALKFVHPVLLEHRSLINTAEGYSLLSVARQKHIKPEVR